MATTRTWTLRGNIVEFSTKSNLIRRNYTRPTPDVTINFGYGRNGQYRTEEVASIILEDDNERDFLQWLREERVAAKNIIIDLLSEEISVSFEDPNDALRCKLAFPEMHGSEEI